MTSIEWLEKELRKNENIRFRGANIEDIFDKAKKIHQSEIVICWHNGYENQSPMIDEENCGQTYYISTYGSKGSDDEFDVEKEMFELEQQLDIPSHMRWHNRTSSQTEISDDDIEEMLFHHSNEYSYGFKDAIKWYREQLKKKQ